MAKSTRPAKKAKARRTKRKAAKRKSAAKRKKKKSVTVKNLPSRTRTKPAVRRIVNVRANATVPPPGLPTPLP